MLNRIITWSLENRFAVIALSLIVAALGAWSITRLPIDAFPDTTPVTVQVNTTAPALGPLEIEQQISQPVERAISGLPGLAEVRSLSKFGFSQVVVLFENGTDLHLARQLVAQRVAAVELPAGVDRPELGPISTGLGEVFHYIVTSDGSVSLRELTTIHDWVIKPQLAAVPGVAEVNTWGGERKQFHVLVSPSRLVSYGLTLGDIIEALQSNNASAGGGYIAQAGEHSIIQGIALTTNLEQVGDIVITTRGRVPIRIRDVGQVREAFELRRGAATADGRGEVVLGLAFMLMGENSHDVTRRVAERLEALTPALPSGVTVRPVYERTELVDLVTRTVLENLAVGALLVVAVLFMFLGSLRAGLIVALAIPLSMLCAGSLMLQTGIAASLMSLGALDFGLVVDSSVVMVENSVRRLALERGQRSRLDIVRDASIEVRRPTMYGELIIMIVYLPILTLEGIEGKLFRPMALTVIFALAGSLVFSLTLMPALASLMLPTNPRHRENWMVRFVQWVYRPIIHWAIHHRAIVLTLAALIVGVSAWLATQLGTQFIPRLSEGAITVNFVHLAGVSLEQAVTDGTNRERVLLRQFPDEVRDVWVRTGTAEIATDPMGIEVSDCFIMLHPRERWTRASTQDELAGLIRQSLETLPGMRIVLSQPIEMRMNEMIAGIRADLGIKVYGDDLATLRTTAGRIEAILQQIEGAADIHVEQLTGQPLMEIRVDQEAIARLGIPASHVLEVVEAIGGITVGEIREDQRRLDLVVRLDDTSRADLDSLRRIPVATPGGERIDLERVAVISQVEGPSTITHESHRRRIVIQTNVSGRDVGSFVHEVRQRLATEVDLPAGYHIAFGGQFEHFERASQRLAFIVPLALLLIMLLLYFSTGSVGDALIIFTGAPFAAVGGIVALWLLEMPFTISAGIGFVAVSGVSMLNGLVLVSTIRQRMAEGVPLFEAIEQTRLIRMRPILMTALVASLGFVPMALNTGVGAEVQRPLAIVVISGVIADNLLTLVVLPALYAAFGAGARRSVHAGAARG